MLQLIGRDADIQRVTSAQRTSGVVTLLGLGGVGKTSVARTVLAGWQGASAWCDLHACADIDAVYDVMTTALQVKVAHVDQLPSAVADLGEILLVLDNAEQVVNEVAQIVEQLPVDQDLCVLVTSRVALRIQGEVVVELAPLEEHHTKALLTDLVRRRTDTWAPEQSELQALAHATSGLPLAIEIVAARAHVLPVPAILRAMHALSNRERGHAERHASVNAAIEWSWRQLTPEVQHTLACLCVVHGTLHVDAAIATTGQPDHVVLDHLVELRDSSLVEPGSRILELVRTYVLARTEAPTAQAARLRFGRWCMEAWHGLTNDPRRLTVFVAKVDIDSLFDVQRYLVEADPVLAHQITEVLWRRMHGVSGRMERMFTLLKPFDSVQVPPDVRVYLDILYCKSARAEGRAYLDRLAAMQRRVAATNDHHLTARVHAFVAFITPHPDSKSSAEWLVHNGQTGLEVLEGCCALTYHCDAAGARALHDVATNAAIRNGRPHQIVSFEVPMVSRMADEAPEECLQIMHHRLQASGEFLVERSLASVHVQIAWLELKLGNLQPAQTHGEIAARMYDDLGDRSNGGSAMLDLAYGDVARHDAATAARRLTACRHAFEKTGRPALLKKPQEAEGLLALLNGHNERAVALLRAPPRPLLAGIADAMRALALFRLDRAPEAELLLADSPWANGVRALMDRHPCADTGPGYLGALLKRWLAHALRLRVHVDGLWFDRGRGPIDLSRRSGPRAILGLVATHHPAPQSMQAMFDVGWPDVRIRQDAAMHRVAVALSTLRKLGLQDVLVRNEEGYQFADNIVIDVISDEG